MSTPPGSDPNANPLPASMQDDYARWLAKKNAQDAARLRSANDVPAFEDARAQMIAAFASLPEKVAVPYHLSPEGERMAKFRKVLEDAPEFLKRIDRSLLPNPEAFDRLAGWNGTFPGPCGMGETDTAKTRAAWSALGRLYVRENKPFAWFPVRRLVTELAKYEERGAADEFFRSYDFYQVLFVDDVDKINWQFDVQKTALFAFYDWIYRKNKPCITTTNKGRAWWADRMGDAFTRRLLDDAHFAVQF